MREKEKLVYRSHFQPAPRVPLGDVVPHKARRGSPFRVISRQRPIARYFLRAGLALVTVYIALVWVRSLTGLDITFGCAPAWFWRQAPVKSMQEWRGNYDTLGTGLGGFPFRLSLPRWEHIPRVNPRALQGPTGIGGEPR